MRLVSGALSGESAFDPQELNPQLFSSLSLLPLNQRDFEYIVTL